MLSGTRKHGLSGAAIFGAALTGMLAGTAARGGEEPARRGFWIPGAFASVETRSASDVLGAVGDMMDGVKPGLGAFFREQLAQNLQVGGAAGLNLLGGDQPAGLLVLNPRRQPGNVVVAVGDGGIQAVLKAIGGAMGQEVEDDLLDFGDFMIGEGNNVLYFRHAAPWVLCSLAPSALDAAAAAVKEGRAPRAPRRRAHLAAHLDMKELREAYGDVVAGALQWARAALSAGGMQLQGPAGGLGRLGMAVLKEYVNAAEGVFQGLDEIDLFVRFSAEAAEIGCEVLPGKDGVFAPMAEAKEPATFAPASALPEGGTIAAAWRADPAAMKPIVEAFARAGARVSLGTDNLNEDDPEAKAKMERFRRLGAGFLAGEGASAVVMSPEGMTGVNASDMDFDAYRDLYGEVLELFTTELAPLFQDTGFGMKQQYEKDVRRLADGGRVDRVTTTYEFQGMMADQMKGMFNFMFGGDKQVVEIGDTGAGAVMGWGREPAKVLDEALERRKAAANFAGPAWPTASKDLARVVENARGVTTAAFEVRAGGYLAMVFSMMRAQPGMDAFLPLGEEDLANLQKKDVPIVGWAGVDRGRLVLYERVPMAAVKNIVEFFEKMRENRAGGGGWEPEPLPGDPEEVW